MESGSETPVALTTGIGNVYRVVDSMDDLLKMCQVLVKSGLLPKTVKSAEAAAVIVLQAREIGIGPMTAFRGINVIYGNPTIAPWLMLALINRSGLLEDLKIDDDGEKCTVTMKRVGRQVHTESFSMEDAKLMTTFEGEGENRKQIPLAQKYNWRQMPKVMRKWRAISACARVVFPDVLAGLYIPEELGSEDLVTDEGYIIEGSATPISEAEGGEGHKPTTSKPNGNKPEPPKASAPPMVEEVKEFIGGVLTYRLRNGVKEVKVSLGGKAVSWWPADLQVIKGTLDGRMPKWNDAKWDMFRGLFLDKNETFDKYEFEGHLLKHFESSVLTTLTWEELMALWEWKKNGRPDPRWYKDKIEKKEPPDNSQAKLGEIREAYYGGALIISAKDDEFLELVAQLPEPLCLTEIEKRYKLKASENIESFASLASLLLEGILVFGNKEFWDTCDAAFQTAVS